MSTAVVIGGGIGGLSASYYLSKSNRFAKVILVEASNRCGGWVRSEENVNDGSVFDLGPRSCKVASSKSALNMIYLTNELGLNKDVLPVVSTHPAVRNRFIYLNKQMFPVKMTSIFGVFKRMPPFTKPIIYSMFRDSYTAKTCKDEDESIFDFMERRLGVEMAMLVVSTLIRGIYAGDASKLSMKACFPDIFEGERKYGSLRKGFRAYAKQRKAEIKSADMNYMREAPLVRDALDKKWSLFSFRHGYQQLTDCLEQTINGAAFGVEVLKNSRCTALRFKDGKAEVEMGNTTIKADHVVSAVYSKDLAGMLGDEHQTLSESLSSIPAVNVVLVSIELAGEHHPNPMAFGHLIPPFEDGKVLGVIYDSCIFREHDRQDGKGSTRFTMMMGGAWYDELLEATGGEFNEDRIRNLALATLFIHLNMDPVKINKIKVRLLENCIPQYVLGHSKRLDTMDSYIAENKLPLSLVGCSYRGVSTPDVVFDSKVEVEKIIKETLK